MAKNDAEPDSGIPNHVASEFFLWLWYRSSVEQGRVDLSEGTVDFWVGDKILFSVPGDEKPAVTLTGEQASLSKEARVAIRSGKVIRTMQVCLRREEREYTATFKAPHLRISAAKLPSLVKGGDDAEVLYERMFLYEELHFLLGRIFQAFAIERQEPDYATLINTWLNRAEE